MIIAQISDSHLALDAPDSKRRIEDFEATIIIDRLVVADIYKKLIVNRWIFHTASLTKKCHLEYDMRTANGDRIIFLDG